AVTSLWLWHTPSILRPAPMQAFAGMRFEVRGPLPWYTSRVRIRLTTLPAGYPALPWTKSGTLPWGIARPAVQSTQASDTRVGFPRIRWAHWRAKTRSSREPALKWGIIDGVITAVYPLTPSTIAPFGTPTNTTSQVGPRTGLPGLLLSSFPPVSRFWL